MLTDFTFTNKFIATIIVAVIAKDMINSIVINNYTNVVEVIKEAKTNVDNNLNMDNIDVNYLDYLNKDMLMCAIN